MKKKMFIVGWQIFPFDVLVCLGSSREEIVKRIGKTTYKLLQEEKEALTMSGQGRTVILNGGQTVLWTKYYPQKGSGVLSHEIFHAVDFILHRVGVKYDNSKSECDEVYAYMIEYLTNQIVKKL